MLCYRGCRLEATHITTKGKHVCNKVAQKCPVVKKKIGEKSGATRRANPVRRTAEQKARQSAVIKKQYASGSRNIDNYRHKIAETNKKHWATVKRVPWNKGLKGAQVAWNKGLKKEEPMDILERDDPIYRNFKQYRNRVAVRTEKVYEEYQHEINPEGYMRGLAGVEGAWHLDHIVSVREGFDNSTSVEEICKKENLQMLPWLDNILKYDGSR